MFFSKIHCRNFKSFQDETISLKKLNILIGSNAAGKSNTVSIFRFISHIIDYGIENAISLSGGFEYVLNTSIGKKEPLYMSFSLDSNNENWVLVVGKQKEEKLFFSGFDYEFEITPYKSRDGFKITKDHIHLRYYVVTEEDEDQKTKVDKSRYYTLDCVRKGSKIVSSHENYTQIDDKVAKKRLEEDLDADFFKRYMNTVGHRKELILKFVHFFLPPVFSSENFVNIYDFDSKMMKKSSILTAISTLNEDGSNLANVLQELLKTPKKRRKLENLLRDCLPFVEGITTEKNFDKSVSYKIKESYSSKPLYANFLSDGTANIIALIVALYFEESSGINIFEEPERNLHPYLMSRLLEMATEISKDKQIVITTHTPELIKYSEIDTLLLANRCEDGYTHITHPADSKMVQDFLQNEVGIDSLFVQNLLGE